MLGANISAASVAPAPVKDVEILPIRNASTAFLFDGKKESFWEVAGANPVRLDLNLVQSAHIVRYSVTSGDHGPESANRMPTAWRLQGSTDGGKTWRDVDVREDEQKWSRNETRSYIVRSPGNAGDYRFVFSNSGGGAVRISEITLVAKKLSRPRSHSKDNFPLRAPDSQASDR